MTSRRTYEQVIDGEPRPIEIGHEALDACCDCGLVHKVRYELIESEDGETRKVIERTWVDRRRTAQLRRWMRKKREGVFGRK